MKLTDKERDILSILEDTDLDSIVLFAEKRLNISDIEVLEILSKLIDLDLVEKISIPADHGGENTELFFRTNNVSPDLLNDSLRYEVETGSKFGEKGKNHPTTQLKNFQNDKSKTYHKVSSKN